MKMIFFISLFLIFYSFIGYPISLIILNKVGKGRKLNIDKQYEPSISIIIPAHNEENVIENKSKIGAGAVVVKDVPENCTVIGNPAIIVKKDGEKVRYNL